jgi:hypothetical protein
MRRVVGKPIFKFQKPLGVSGALCTNRVMLRRLPETRDNEVLFTTVFSSSYKIIQSLLAA